MQASECKRLNELQAENARLKSIYAELSLDYQMAKEIIEKTRQLTGCQKSQLAQEFCQYSPSRASSVLSISRSVLYYQRKKVDDQPLRTSLKEQAAQHPI